MVWPKFIFGFAVLLFYIVSCRVPTQRIVTSFEECVAAGNPVMEPYPRQCRHNDQNFVEEIGGCTNALKKCPDGSFVERILPDCEFAECPSEDIPEQHYCTPESRQAEGCFTLYDPVCGWNDPDKIQCIKYPCASTYSNSCFACMDENVLYWTEGECPK